MKSIKNTITFLFMCLMVFSFGYSSSSVDLKDQIERKRQNQMHPEQEKINYYLNNFGSIPEELELTIINNRDCDSDDQTEYSWSCGNGSWGSEVSWQLSASGDTTVIANGGAPTAGTICLADGDYTLTMIDSYGDGWNGNVFVVSSLDSTDATVFASCTLDTGLNGECSFSLGGAPPVSGCTNPNAPNYDADAVLDDGSCEDFCLGNLDSGSCGYFMDMGGYTCETLEGYGYDCTACADAGVCDAPLECAEGQFMCSSGDQCIPEGFVCDGSSEYGNAGWGPDCTDGSDEILEDCCAAGALSYEGYCPDVGDVPGCTDVEACNFDELATFDNGSCLFNDCNGECGGAAVEDCYGVCGGTAITDACGECEGDGSACAGCANASYYADSYCDASNNTAECNYDGGDCCPSDCLDPGANDPNDLYDCATNGGDCLDCIDPSSADLAEGGECDPNVDPPTAPTGLACEGGYDVVDGPTINLSWDAVEGAENYEVFYYLPSCEEQGLVTCWDGTCAESEDDCSVQGECAEGEVLDCAEGDFDCVTAAWIGDGYCDGTAQAYGADLCCFDLDGGDCTPAECGDTTPVDCPAEWNACLASIVDTEYYEACADPDCTGGAGGSCDGSVVPFLTDECGAAANNIGGGVCPDPCGGDAGTGCAVGEFECGDGSCIPGSYYCDGSSEYGNAFWGPDCADGSDEVLADCCDAGAASYNGYCGGDTGGDDAGGDDAGGDDGGSSCEDTDNGATDPYGDSCAEYNSFPSWCGNYDDDDFVSNEMCCVCGGGTTSDGGMVIIDNPIAHIVKTMDIDDRIDFIYREKYGITVFEKMQEAGEINIQFLINNGFINNDTREWTSIGLTEMTEMTITGVGDSEWSFGVTAINFGGSSDMVTVDGCSGGELAEGDLTTPYNVMAEGQCDDYDEDGVEDSAVEWTWDDDNFEDVICADGSEPLVDCAGTEFCNNEPQFTGYDCYVGCVNSYLGDTYCDDGTWGVDFQCEEYGGDCGDCEGVVLDDPNGYCGDTGGDDGVAGCADGEFECGDGSCIPGSYYCDGSTEYGNAFWGPDCADGSDEVLADCCDAGAASYDGYCDGDTGGDDTGGDTGGDDGGASCEDTDNGAVDPYGDGCAEYNSFPSWCGNYDDDDFISNEMCCVCGGGTTSDGGMVIIDNPIAHTIKTMDRDDRVDFINQIKSNRRSVFNLIDPPMIVDVEGSILLNPAPNNRVISYEVNVFCDACLDGEAWSQSYNSVTTDFLIYGIDEGVDVCAEVRAVSSNTATVSAWSDAACTSAGCGPNCVAGDANNDGNVNVSDIVLLVGSILNNSGSTDGVECGDMDSGGVINVSDIVAIINIILNPMSSTSDATEAKLNIGTDVSIVADGQLSAIQMVLSHDSDFSLELTQDAWVADYSTIDNKTTLIVVMPSSEYLFTPNGEFTIEESIVLNSENQIDVTLNSLPIEFSVSDAYPNPFNPVTVLNINLPSESMVKVNVYNVTGQMIDAIYSNSLTAGTHSISWDASNLSSGVYLIRTEAGKNISTQKVMLLK